MEEKERLPGLRHSLGVYALLGFVVSFLVARSFTTVAPDTVVVSGGIHFHHFWYGLAMVTAAGWLGIVYNHPRLDNIYALVFGLGAGLIGDEVGLLLTLGDYQSELTVEFFVVAMSFAIGLILFFNYREEIVHDLMLGRGERIVHLGIVVAALSAVAFASNSYFVGSILLAVGAVAITAGYLVQKGSRIAR